MVKKNKEQGYSDLNLEQRRLILSVFMDVMLDPAFEDSTLSAVHQAGVDNLNTMILSEYGINKTAIPDYNWAKTSNRMSLKSIRSSIDKWNNKRFSMHFLSDDGFPLLPGKPTPEDHKEYELKKKYITTIESNLQIIREMMKTQLVYGIKPTIRDVYWFAKLSRMYGDIHTMEGDSVHEVFTRSVTIDQIWAAAKAYSREELAFEFTAKKNEKFDTSYLDATFIYFTERDILLDLTEENANSIGVQHNIAMALGLVPNTKEYELGARKYAAKMPIDSAILKDRFVHESEHGLDWIEYNLVHEGKIPAAEYEAVVRSPGGDLLLLAWQYVAASVDPASALDVAKQVYDLAKEEGFNNNLKIQELLGLENLKYITEEIYINDPFDKTQIKINQRRLEHEQKK